jgi:hypothetical protein
MTGISIVGVSLLLRNNQISSSLPTLLVCDGMIVIVIFVIAGSFHENETLLSTMSPVFSIFILQVDTYEVQVFPTFKFFIVTK